ncbi:MAG: hypothetical protein ACXIVQ_07075 [Acidimicrobiales bacterium]
MSGSSTRSIRLRALAIGATLLTLVAVATPVDAGVPVPTQAGQGLTTTTATVYEIDPDLPGVRVTTTVTISNAGPFVYEGYGTAIFTDAQQVSARNTAGGALSVRRRSIDSPMFQLADMTLSPLLAPGQTQTLELRSVLPALPARGEGFARVNAAYVTFPLIAVGDPGRVDVSVVVPPGFEWTVIGDDLEQTTDDTGRTTLRATAIPRPDDFFATVAVFSEDRLTSRPVVAAGRTFDVLSWPGDDEWSAFVVDVVERGIPALEDAIGVPMPGDDDMRIIETFSPYLYGYAGWYIPDEGLIEIGDELDGEVVLHELAHVWFNTSTFRSRWINEGLAELFAVETAGRLGLDAPGPEPVDPDDPLAVPLNAWTTPNWFDDQADDRERWGYQASFWVLELFRQEIGIDGVRDVVSAAIEGRDAYRLRPEGTPVPTDWRALLDLLEEVGGSEDATEVFDRFVVTEPERLVLGDRQVARIHYLALVERRDDLDTPPAVREAMARWRFDNVEDMVDTSLRYLDRLDTIDAAASQLGLTAPAVLVDDYEAAEDLGGLHDGADRATDSLRGIADATAASDDATGPFVAIGGWFIDPEEDLDEARGAFERGSWDDSDAAASRAIDGYGRLATLGLAAVGGLLAALVVLAAATYLIVRFRRRPRGMPVTTEPLDAT